MGWKTRLAGLLGIGGAGTYTLDSFGSNEDYISYATRNHLIVTAAHPGANGRNVAYEPVYEDAARTRLKTTTVNGEERVMVQVLDPDSREKLPIAELGGTGEVPSVYNRADFERAQTEAFRSQEAEIGRIRSMGAAGRAGRRLGRGGRETIDAMVGPSSSERVSQGLRNAGAGGSGGSGFWNTVKPFLPYAGPVAGIAIAALGNFSIPMLLLGGGVAAAGIFASDIEQGIGRQRALREGREAAAGNGNEPRSGPEVTQHVDAPVSARDVASQIDIPTTARFASAEATTPEGGAPTVPRPQGSGSGGPAVAT